MGFPLVPDISRLLPECGTYVPRRGHTARARGPFRTTEIMWAIIPGERAGRNQVSRKIYFGQSARLAATIRAMGQIGDWLDTSDKVASVLGALAGVAAVLLALHASRSRRRKQIPAPPGEMLASLLRAQDHDASRHRYYFFEDHIPSLNEVYVRQQVAQAATAQRTVDVEEMLDSTNHTVLLGGAGAGKSALVAAVVADSAQAGNRQKVFTVAVSGSDLVDRSIPEALQRACKQDLKVEVPASFFEQPPVRGGRWRVMIDGIDEIIDARARSRLLWSLHQWLQEPSTPHQLVITSRPLPDSEMAELRPASVFDMQPFDRDDLDTFAIRWFNARHPDEDIAAQLATRFVARVAGARLGPVARVPLLATIAALVFEHDSERPLPSSRAALYERFVEHLLTGRHELKHLRDAIDLALSTGDKECAELASWLRDDFPGVINGMLEAVGSEQVRHPGTDLTGVAAAWIQQQSGKDLLSLVPDGRRLLRDLLLATGMLAPRSGRLQFSHQSFAEYLAARESASRFEVATWHDLMANPAARSLAAFMAAARPDADQLVSGLLDSGFEAPAAGDLLADGVAVEAHTRQRVIEALTTAVSSNSASSGESLRVLRELSVDADVFRALTAIATDNRADPWARAAVADAIADVDHAAGIRLLRQAAQAADPAVLAWIVLALAARGSELGPVEWEAPKGPLGVLGRQALARHVDDKGISDDDRVEAAAHLAHDGEYGPIRSLLETPGIHDAARLRAAEILAGQYDDAALLALASGSSADGFYVPDSAVSHSLRYSAVTSLHRRRHTSAGALLQSFVDSTNAPCTFGAAAMLAETGQFDALVEVASGQRVHPVLALAAAKNLATTADTATLERAAKLITTPKPQTWVVAGLVDRGRTAYVADLRKLLHRSQWPLGTKIELQAKLAAHGEGEALRWLRRRAAFALSSRHRIAAIIAMCTISKPKQPLAPVLAPVNRDVPLSSEHDRLRRIAGRSLSSTARIHAAAALGRLHTDLGWQPLRDLTTTLRPAHRLHAAARLANETSDVAPILAMILDNTVAPRYRAQATELLRRNASRINDTAENSWEEYPPLGSAFRWAEQGNRLYRIPLGLWQQLSLPQATALATLAEQSSTPARLRIAIADAGLPQDMALALLTAIATDPKTASWHRMRAAWSLQDYDSLAAEQLIRTLIADPKMPRVLRWFELIEADEDSWEEFAESLARYRRIEEGPPWLRLPRLALLVLTRP